MYVSHLSPTKIIASFLALFLLTLCFSGCGGGALSQEDMIRMSRRRTDKEKNDDEPQKATNNTPVVVEKTVMKEPAEVAEAAEKSSSASEPEDIRESKSRAETINPPQMLVSDTKQKPRKKLSFDERCQLSASNLKHIGQALEAYLRDQGKYPSQAIYGATKSRLLSWRVELLPYLGYRNLYEAFDRTKPWNHPANKPLIKKIPAIYQSPERFDAQTNYLLVTGSNTVFPSHRTLHLRRVEDGIEHCALVVEVDENLATPWTKPTEYDASLSNPQKNLGGLRREHVFVLWGGGMVAAMPTSLKDKTFKAMYTVDSGERFSSYDVSLPIDENFLAKVLPATTSVASASNSSEHSSLTSGRSPSRLAVSENSLAGEYLGAALTNYSMRQPADALLWYYASNLLQESSVRWDSAYQWIPALQRPSPTVHFSVGVRGKAAQRNSSLSRRGSRNLEDSGRSEIVSQITEVGVELLEIIEHHAISVVPGSLAQSNEVEQPSSRGSGRKGNNRKMPLPISYLGIATRGELTTAAVAKAADVLVLFDVKANSSSDAKWIACDLIDLARGKKILSIPRIHWLASAGALESLKRDETFKKKRWQLQDMLEDSLSFQDWPDGLKSKHAAARTSSLADLKTFNPLAALAEMAVYRNRGLIDNQQLLLGFQSLLGHEEGESLMLGSTKKRKRVLRNWLPETQPEELQQLAQLRRQRDGNDD